MRRTTKRKQLEQIIVLIIISLSCILLAYITNEASPLQTEAQQAIVIRVIDGDTIEVDLDGEIERIRLIGIDAPEMGFYGAVYEDGATEATDFVNATLRTNRYIVYLTSSGNDRDRWGRLRRYVWLEYPNDQSISLNHLMLVML